PSRGAGTESSSTARDSAPAAPPARDSPRVLPRRLVRPWDGLIPPVEIILDEICRADARVDRSTAHESWRSGEIGMQENEQNRAEVRSIVAAVDAAVVDRLLQGAVDLHVHSGPSIMARQL